MKRSVSLLLILLVGVAAWVLARPGGGDDLKSPQPLAAFEQAQAQQSPAFIMFTSDT